MIDIKDDIVTLMGTKEDVLQNLCDNVIVLISHAMVETLRDCQSITSVNIGIGELKITKMSDGFKYKFIPCAKFERALTDSYKSGKSRLTVKLETTLEDRLAKARKELF